VFEKDFMKPILKIARELFKRMDWGEGIHKNKRGCI
jgi:hypothetical protein